MSIRYASQIRESDCGPISIFNLLKWIGIRVNLRDHHRLLCELCNNSPEFGSSEKDLTRALSKIKKKVKFSFSYIKRPNGNNIITHLKSGGSAILVFQNEVGMHACFIPSIEREKEIILINAFDDETKSVLTKAAFLKLTKIRPIRVWLIKKINQKNLPRPKSAL